MVGALHVLAADAHAGRGREAAAGIARLCGDGAPRAQRLLLAYLSWRIRQLAALQPRAFWPMLARCFEDAAAILVGSMDEGA